MQSLTYPCNLMPRKKTTTAVVEEVTANDVEVQLSNPEVNETFLKLQDNLHNALVKAEQELKAIDDKADYAIAVVSQSIKTRAIVEKGKVLLSLKGNYHTTADFEGTWKDWLATVGLNDRMAQRWMSAAKLVEDTQGVFSEDAVLNLPYATLDAIQRLPSDYKIEVLEKVEEGEKPTAKEVEQLAKQPEVKLSKAQELLSEARQKRDEKAAVLEEVKADPDISYADPEYNRANAGAAHANKRVEDLEEQTELLRKQLKKQQDLAATEAKARSIAETELESLKFDDVAARNQRVKRIQSTLTIQIPQIMGDIQKFLAEKEHYEAAYQEAISVLLNDLSSYLNEHSV